MTYTTRPCCAGDKCNVRIKVFISTEFDRFIIISGYKQNAHTSHPKLTSLEVKPLPKTMPDAEIAMQQDLSAVATLLNMRERFLLNRTLLQYSKYAINKIVKEQRYFDYKNECEVGERSSAEQLISSLRANKNMNFAALFYNDCASNYVKMCKRVQLVTYDKERGNAPIKQDAKVDAKFHENMKLLMKKLNINGKILLACS